MLDKGSELIKDLILGKPAGTLTAEDVAWVRARRDYFTEADLQRLGVKVEEEAVEVPTKGKKKAE